MGVKILWGALLGLWLVLVLAGKGGFVHILMFIGISIMLVDLVSQYRAGYFRRKKSPAE